MQKESPNQEKEIIKYPLISGVTFAENNIPSVFPSHWHNAAEFTVVLKDGCRYKIGETIYTPEAGDILLVWPRELHEILRMPQKGVVFMQFSSRLMENNTDLIAASRFLNECHLISAKKEQTLTRKLKELIYTIRELHSKKQYFVETKCKLVIYEILILIGEYVMQEHREQIGDERFSDKSWDYIRAACSYIAEHASENIAQTEVADHTGLSPFYFSKLFHEYTQMTFPAYLSSIRVQTAINLLASEQFSITDCAFMAGFQSTTAFNKVFHDFTGCTPREFRKLHRQNR